MPLIQIMQKIRDRDGCTIDTENLSIRGSSYPDIIPIKVCTGEYENIWGTRLCESKQDLERGYLIYMSISCYHRKSHA